MVQPTAEQQYAAFVARAPYPTADARATLRQFLHLPPTPPEYDDETLTQALQAAHDAACGVLGLNPEIHHSPVAYNGPCGLEPQSHINGWVETWLKRNPAAFTSDSE